ncbi:hypothetical protein ACWIGI_40530 [Nocardia sp. NPDC055321]
MYAGIARAAAVAALAVPLVVRAAPTALADQGGRADVADQTPVEVDQLRRNADAPYIWINICVHIPTPGSATLDWCFP